MLLLHRVSSAGVHCAGQSEPVPAPRHVTHHPNQQRPAGFSCEMISHQSQWEKGSVLPWVWAGLLWAGLWDSWTQKMITKRRQSLAVLLSCLCPGPCTDYLCLKNFWTQKWQRAQNSKPPWAGHYGLGQLIALQTGITYSIKDFPAWPESGNSAEKKNKNPSVESSTSYKLQQMNAIILQGEYINIDDRYITHINIE